MLPLFIYNLINFHIYKLEIYFFQYLQEFKPFLNVWKVVNTWMKNFPLWMTVTWENVDSKRAEVFIEENLPIYISIFHKGFYFWRFYSDIQGNIHLNPSEKQNFTILSDILSNCSTEAMSNK